MPDMIRATAELIQPGVTVFARIQDTDGESLSYCKVIEFHSSQGDINSVSAVLSVSNSAAFSRLEPGAGVAVMLLAENILFSTLATVVEFTADDQPALRLLLPNQCRGRSLRTHQRYHAMGTFILRPDEPLDKYYQSSPVPVNISLGGFGLQVNNLAIESEQEISFELKVMVAAGDTVDPGCPELRLSGKAIARFIMTLDSDQTSYCGFQFSRLDNQMQVELAFWIRTHEALLREA